MNKNNYTTVVLIGLVVLNIIDGDFKNPTLLDYVKILLMIICLALTIGGNHGRKKD